MLGKSFLFTVMPVKGGSALVRVPSLPSQITHQAAGAAEYPCQADRPPDHVDIRAGQQDQESGKKDPAGDFDNAVDKCKYSVAYAVLDPTADVDHSQEQIKPARQAKSAAAQGDDGGVIDENADGQASQQLHEYKEGNGDACHERGTLPEGGTDAIHLAGAVILTGEGCRACPREPKGIWTRFSIRTVAV